MAPRKTKPAEIEPKPRVKIINAGVLRSVNDTDNSAFFAAASDKPIDAYCSDGERKRLRADCRKILLDSPWAANLARSLSLASYGTGPAVQVRTPDGELNTRLESAFNQWRKETAYDSLFATAISALASDGEAFFHIYENPHISNALGIELIDPGRIADHTPSIAPNEFCGVAYDDFGAPLLYHVRDANINPDSHVFSISDIPACSIEHLFLPLLPTQRRGLPLLQAAIHSLASLKKLEDSTLAAAETASNLSFVITSKFDPEQLQSSNSIEAPRGAIYDGFDPVSLPTERNTGLMLPDNFNISQFKAEQPNLNVVAFQENVLTGIGACIGAPRNIALNDSSSYNYSSARLDSKLFDRWTSLIQARAEYILSSHFRTFLATVEPALIDRLGQFYSTVSQTPVSWFWNAPEYLDRLHEAQADIQLLNAGLLSLRDYYSRRGKDWEAELKQIAIERKMLKDLGISGTGTIIATEDATNDIAES